SRRGVPASSACTCGCPLDSASEEVDAVARGDADNRALGVVALAVPEPGALALTGPVEGVDARHLDVEDLLDGNLDLRLVGVRVNDERVLVLVDESIALLRDDRSKQHVARVRDHAESPPAGVSGVSSASAVSAAESVSLSAA